MGTTRLPDLVLDDLKVEGKSVQATIRCADPAWPGGEVLVRIRTPRRDHLVSVAVSGGEGALRWEGEAAPTEIEIDPERIYLDPVRSNGLWKR